MRVRRRSAVVGAALLFGCDAPAAPLLVDGAQRFEPPPVYQFWWDLAQECSGRRGFFARVRWYYVPGTQTLTVNGRRVEGYWTSAGNTIVLAEAAMMKGSLVRHEMLHSLQDGAGHPREFFLDRCGGVVLCDGPCIEEAEPPPPAGQAVAQVGADALEIDVEIRPNPPSRALYRGFFAVIVTARNPRSDSVVVTLPATMVGEPGTTFEYRRESAVAAEGGGIRSRDDAATRFAPGEVKRQMFDFYMYKAVGEGDAGLLPGTHTFSGAYAGRWAAENRTVTVTEP